MSPAPRKPMRTVFVGGSHHGRWVSLYWPPAPTYEILSREWDPDALRFGREIVPMIGREWYEARRYVERVVIATSTKHGQARVECGREVWVLMKDTADKATVQDAAEREIAGQPWTFEEPNILDDYADWFLWWQLKHGVEYYEPTVAFVLRGLRSRKYRGTLRMGRESAGA